MTLFWVGTNMPAMGAKVMWGDHGGRAYRVGTNGRVKFYELKKGGDKVLVGTTSGKHTPEGVVFQDGDQLIRVSLRKSEAVEPGRNRGDAVVGSTKEAALTHEQADRKRDIVFVNGAPWLKSTWAFRDGEHFAEVMTGWFRKNLDLDHSSEAALKEEAKPFLLAIFNAAQRGGVSEKDTYEAAKLVVMSADAFGEKSTFEGGRHARKMRQIREGMRKRTLKNQFSGQAKKMGSLLSQDGPVGDFRSGNEIQSLNMKFLENAMRATVGRMIRDFEPHRNGKTFHEGRE